MTATDHELVATLGVPENRTREQWTAEILRHPPGEPGHVYVAQVLARVRADNLGQLISILRAYALGRGEA